MSTTSPRQVLRPIRKGMEIDKVPFSSALQLLRLSALVQAGESVRSMCARAPNRPTEPEQTSLTYIPWCRMAYCSICGGRE